MDLLRPILSCLVSQVATAHSIDMSSLLRNPELVNLLGGLEAVILGDGMMLKTKSQKKTRLERKGAPVFDTMVEVIGRGRWRLHRDVGGSVDSMLSGGHGDTEIREWSEEGAHGEPPRMLVQFESPRAAQLAAMEAAGVGGSYCQGAGIGQAPSYSSVLTGSSLSAGSWLLELIQSAVTLGYTSSAADASLPATV